MPLKYTYDISGAKDIRCEQMRQDGQARPSVLAVTVVFIEDTKICQLTGMCTVHMLEIVGILASNMTATDRVPTHVLIVIET